MAYQTASLLRSVYRHSSSILAAPAVDLLASDHRPSSLLSSRRASAASVLESDDQELRCRHRLEWPLTKLLGHSTDEAVGL